MSKWVCLFGCKAADFVLTVRACSTGHHSARMSGSDSGPCCHHLAFARQAITADGKRVRQEGFPVRQQFIGPRAHGNFALLCFADCFADCFAFCFTGCFLFSESAGRLFQYAPAPSTGF